MTTIDVDGFRRDGWLLVPSVLDRGELDTIDDAVTELERWAHDGGPGLHHFEQTESGAVIARSEDFVNDSDVLRAFICSGVVMRVLQELFGEQAVLFKEKINYKHPGGGGFAPHQDAVAYRFVDHHISCMVPLDPATEASGCLWVCAGLRTGPTADRRSRPHRIIGCRHTELATRPGRARRPAVLRFVHTALQRDEHDQPAATRGVPHLQRCVTRRPS